MRRVIKVKPNSKGEILIKLYGMDYQIVIEDEKKKNKKSDVNGEIEMETS